MRFEQAIFDSFASDPKLALLGSIASNDRQDLRIGTLIPVYWALSSCIQVPKVPY